MVMHFSKPRDSPKMVVSVGATKKASSSFLVIVMVSVDCSLGQFISLSSCLRCLRGGVGWQATGWARHKRGPVERLQPARFPAKLTNRPVPLMMRGPGAEGPTWLKKGGH
jgi:hypothetical protein